MTKLFLCGDLMTGRGIDQILRHPSDPSIRERAVHDAREYVELAESLNGPIARRVDDAYVWGSALDEIDREVPDARLVNLETSITRSADYWPKGINYRMHPNNIGCLTAAGIDVCGLANNHVLDFGEAGLKETLASLARVGIRTVGAGRDRAEAWRPVRLKSSQGQDVVIFAFGCESSGVPASWAATQERPGVAFLEDLSEDTSALVLDRVRRAKRPGDVVIVSIHWGSNWGYAIPREHVRFAHNLIEGGVHLIHGHSSHHPMPIEVYRQRLILYGCGDLINDYEGISGYEEFRPDLALAYFPTLGAAGDLSSLRMTPFQMTRMRLDRPSPDDVEWLVRSIGEIGERFGTRAEIADDGVYQLRWGDARSRTRH